MTDPSPCPCGLLAPYERCCGAFHRGATAAPTAERLMRSRYSAFVVGDAAYLRATWHPDTVPATIHVGADRTWTGLEVEATSGGDLFDDAGEVTFVASFRRGKRPGQIRERSAFVRVEGRWVYVGPVPVT